MFWTPAFAGVTTKETFYEIILFLTLSFGFYNGVSTELVPQGSQELL